MSHVASVLGCSAGARSAENGREEDTEDQGDGRPVHGPSTHPQSRYATRISGGMIELRLEP